jgi:pimeloyl-ACP methyl ester carboxylesterase
MGADVAAVRDSTPAELAIGAGHSMGGAALVMAQLDDPGRFEALVLYEPIVPAPPFRRNPEELLARLARKRRREFASRAEALSNYAGKPPFDRWDRRALEGYVQSGVLDRTGGAELACRPATEAEVFIASRAHAVFERLDEIEIPVMVVYGAETDTYPLEFAEEIAGRFPHGDLVIEPETGHFGPMERPEALARLIEQAVTK